MEIILRQDVDKLGRFGDVVKVKDGYARNFLIPKELAYAKTPSTMRIIETQKRCRDAQALREIKEAEALASRLGSMSCTIRAKVGQDERLYGSVTSDDIADALREEGIELDKRKIDIEESIRTLGVYLVPVRLCPNVKANLKVWVVKE